MKKIGKLLIIILLIVSVLIAKKIIDRRTENYTEIVKHSLNAFYVTANTKDLQPIIEIMNKHQDDRNYTNRLQDYASKEVEKWFTNMEGKYLCNKTNLNACPEALEENKHINTILDVLYSVKTDDNNTIINPSTYKSLSRQGAQNINNIEAIIKSPSSRNAKNSEEIREQRCKQAIECQCNNNSPTCSCKYIESDIIYTLVCKNKDYVPKEE